jgi:hypothetical protein
LLCRIHALHTESDGVFGSPRMYDELRYLGETCSLNRVARLMQSARLVGNHTAIIHLLDNILNVRRTECFTEDSLG